MALEKKYVIVSTRSEGPDITILETLDETSKPPNIVKMATFRLGTDEYEQLGEPPTRRKLKVTIEVEKKEEKAATPATP